MKLLLIKKKRLREIILCLEKNCVTLVWTFFAQRKYFVPGLAGYLMECKVLHIFCIYCVLHEFFLVIYGCQNVRLIILHYLGHLM